MKPTAREYAAAEMRGAEARRGGQQSGMNPWRNAHDEKGSLLRDAWADGYWQQRNRLAQRA